MKILIYACHFAPDPISVGKFTGEMAEWLAVHGHEVRVVAAPPFYPHWKIANEYSALRYTHRPIGNIDVIRCPIWIPKKQSGIARLFHSLSFAVSSAPIMLWRSLSWRPDVIWTVMPPFSAAPSALLGAALAQAHSWLHVQDFEVDAAFELDLLRSPIMRKMLLGVERWLLSRFDVVSTITPRMIERLEEKRIATKTQLFPNWADIDTIFPTDDDGKLRAELGIPKNAFVGLYSGNLGEKQGVECLIEVARHLASQPDIAIVVCGDGAGRERLASLAEGVDNIQLFPLQPLSRLNELLNMADVHLLPQKTKVADFVMPSKLGGMLASGRPVIAGAAAGTQLAREVDGCGVVVPPEDARAMAMALLELRESPEQRKFLGAAGAQRAQMHWRKSTIISHFEQELRRMNSPSY